MIIVSYDGGGIRGVIPADATRRMASVRPYFLEDVDIFAGTSTGSIIAAALAAGIPPEEVVQLYQSRASDIFATRDWLDGLSPVDEYLRANYAQDGLLQALTDVFGERTLGDLRKHVVIPTIYLGHDDGSGRRYASVKVFHNFAGNDRDAKVVDVLLASSAAPTFFPSAEDVDGRFLGRFVDGGLAANNPAACALAKAVKEGSSLDDCWLLSFSCGRSPLVIEGGDWGARQWVVKGAPLVTLAFDTQVGVPDYLVRNMLPRGQYCRVDPVMEEPYGLDDIEAVPEMLKASRSIDLRDAAAWVDAAA